MIKTLLATCLVVAIKAEADPYYLGGYYGVPFGSSTGLDPITQGLDASTQGLAPYAHFGYGHHGLIYGKRSAEADPFYGYGYAAVPFGSSTGLDPITQGLDASTQGYAPYAYGHYGYGHHGLIYGKRSADAEADPYYGFGYAAVPFGSSTGLDPITQGLDASTQGYAPYAYGHLGYGLGHIYGKRSAEADPYYLGGYYGVPFGSSTGLDPITQGLDASTQGYAPYAYGHLGYGLHGAYLG